MRDKCSAGMYSALHSALPICTSRSKRASSSPTSNSLWYSLCFDICSADSSWLSWVWGLGRYWVSGQHGALGLARCRVLGLAGCRVHWGWLGAGCWPSTAGASRFEGCCSSSCLVMYTECRNPVCGISCSNRRPHTSTSTSTSTSPAPRKCNLKWNGNQKIPT